MIDYTDWGDKPVPAIDSDSKPYWDGAREGKLVVQQCEQCKTYQFYPRSVCKHCWSDDLTTCTAPGSGRVYSYTICHRPGQPGYGDDTPYNIALVNVDLPEDSKDHVRILSHVVDCELDEIHIGMEVTVVFRCIDEEDGVHLPLFEPRI